MNGHSILLCLLVLIIFYIIFKHTRYAYNEKNAEIQGKIDELTKNQITLRTQHQGKRKQNQIVLTGTLCLTCKQDRYYKFRQAILSILANHSAQQLSKVDFFVINEYTNNPLVHSQIEQLQNEFPFIQFVQKTNMEDQGQARSLNIILGKIKDYTYWIHWEETWIVKETFLEEIVWIMESTNIDQLQLTNDWFNDVSPERQKFIIETPYNKHRKVYEIRPHENAILNIQTGQRPGSEWPSYSLRPSINRSSFFQNLGVFNEDPKLWPGKFEWDFGNAFILANGVKAVLDKPIVFRQWNHSSTY
jgi:hypothetical protein